MLAKTARPLGRAIQAIGPSLREATPWSMWSGSVRTNTTIVKLLNASDGFEVLPFDESCRLREACSLPEGSTSFDDMKRVVEQHHKLAASAQGSAAPFQALYATSATRNMGTRLIRLAEDVASGNMQGKSGLASQCLNGAKGLGKTSVLKAFAAAVPALFPTTSVLYFNAVESRKLLQRSSLEDSVVQALSRTVAPDVLSKPDSMSLPSWLEAIDQRVILLVDEFQCLYRVGSSEGVLRDNALEALDFIAMLADTGHATGRVGAVLTGSTSVCPQLVSLTADVTDKATVSSYPLLLHGPPNLNSDKFVNIEIMPKLSSLTADAKEIITHMRGKRRERVAAAPADAPLDTDSIDELARFLAFGAPGNARRTERLLLRHLDDIPTGQPINKLTDAMLRDFEAFRGTFWKHNSGVCGQSRDDPLLWDPSKLHAVSADDFKAVLKGADPYNISSRLATLVDSELVIPVSVAPAEFGYILADMLAYGPPSEKPPSAEMWTRLSSLASTVMDYTPQIIAVSQAAARYL